MAGLGIPEWILIVAAVLLLYANHKLPGLIRNASREEHLKNAKSNPHSTFKS